MSQLASTDAYERLIAAVSAFDKRTLEISDYLMKCANLATTAMNNDDPSKALEQKIASIVTKMLDVSDKAGTIKAAMQKTYDALLELEKDEQGEA